jgi:LPS-assembly lipoprotein
MPRQALLWGRQQQADRQLRGGGVKRRQALGLAVGASLSGCGFQPVYMPTTSGKAGVAQRELAAIHVAIIPDRPGQVLREELQRRFEGSGSGVSQRYELRVGFGIAGDAIAILPNSNPTRIREVGSASWTLVAQDPAHTTLTTGSAKAVDGYNLIESQYFASDLENSVVQRRLANALADQITMQLAVHFRQQAAKSG